MPEQFLPAMGQGLVVRIPLNRSFKAEVAGPARFLAGPPYLHALLFDPGGILGLVPLASKISPSTPWNGVGSHLALFRGSIPRAADSLCTLRRADYPYTTQHSVPPAGTLGRKVFISRWLPPAGFRNCLPYLFPLLQAYPGAPQIS